MVAMVWTYTATYVLGSHWLPEAVRMVFCFVEGEV